MSSRSDHEAIHATPLGAFALELRANGSAVDGASLAVEVERNLRDFPLLCFRDQTLGSEELVEVTRTLGPLEAYDPPDPASPGPSEIAVVANDPQRGMVPTPYWHVDGLAREVPPRLTCFYAVEAPPGSETLFLDTRALLASLPAEEREELRALEAVLSSGARHPVVRRDPVLADEAICVNLRHTVGFAGVERSHAERVFSEIAALFRDPELTYVHAYRPGDLLIWNNYALAHSAAQPPQAGERRLMWRIDVRPPAAVA